MTTHRLVTAIALAGMLTAGCHHNPPAATQPSVRAVSKPSPAQAPTGSKAAIVQGEQPVFTDQPRTAQAVAEKANSYAQQVGAIVDRNQPSTGFVHSVKAPTNTQDLRLAPIEVETHVAHSKFAEGDSSPAAVPNSGLSIEHSGDNAVQSSVKVAAPASIVPPAPVIAPAIPQPLLSGPSSEELTRRLAQRAREYPQDVGNQFDYQLLQFVHGDMVGDAQSLAGLPGEDREMLQAIMDGLSNFRNGARADNNMLLSRKIRPMLEMSDRLRAQAELTIPVVALCRRVYKYGTYDSIEPARFAAGAEQEIIVYCEVENFASQLLSSKVWETRLTQELVLYTDPGQMVWQADKVRPTPTVDYSRTRRHDFFLARKIRLPANLSIGRYTMKVTVVDHEMNRVAENTIQLEIASQ